LFIDGEEVPMANLVRRRQENEMVPAGAGRFDPLRLMRDWLRFDPFSGMTALPSLIGQSDVMWMPEFEVKETPEAYLFKADLPGVKLEDLDISLVRNRLVVSGKREAEQQQEGDTFYALERSYGSFTRAFTLPADIDADSVRGDLKDGVLTLTIAKRPEEQPKKIEIKAQQQPSKEKVKA
jgi:HSP20 family protein